MKIFINASNLSAGGGIQVANSLLAALKKRKDNRYAVALSPQLKNTLPPLNSFPDNFVFSEKTDRNYSPVRVFSGRCGSLDDFLKETGSEIVFTVFGPAYWTPRGVPHLCGYALPFYIYPDSPALADIGFLNRLKFQFNKFLRMRAFRINCRAAVTETEDVSARLKKMLPGHRIYTVSNAYNQVFDDPSAQEELPLPPFDGVTLLTVSAAYRHKNLGLIVRTAEWLKKNSPDFRFRFVLTVEPEKLGFARENVPPELLLTGRVNVAASVWKNLCLLQICLSPEAFAGMLLNISIRFQRKRQEDLYCVFLLMKKEKRNLLKKAERDFRFFFPLNRELTDIWKFLRMN